MVETKLVVILLSPFIADKSFIMPCFFLVSIGMSSPIIDISSDVDMTTSQQLDYFQVHINNSVMVFVSTSEYDGEHARPMHAKMIILYNPSYSLSNVIMADEQLASFDQYLRYCHKSITIVFSIPGAIM